MYLKYMVAIEVKSVDGAIENILMRRTLDLINGKKIIDRIF